MNSSLDPHPLSGRSLASGAGAARACREDLEMSARFCLLASSSRLLLFAACLHSLARRTWALASMRPRRSGSISRTSRHTLFLDSEGEERRCGGRRSPLRGTVCSRRSPVRCRLSPSSRPSSECYRSAIHLPSTRLTVLRSLARREDRAAGFRVEPPVCSIQPLLIWSRCGARAHGSLSAAWPLRATSRITAALPSEAYGRGLLALQRA